MRKLVVLIGFWLLGSCVVQRRVDPVTLDAPGGRCVVNRLDRSFLWWNSTNCDGCRDQSIRCEYP